MKELTDIEFNMLCILEMAMKNQEYLTFDFLKKSIKRYNFSDKVELSNENIMRYMIKNSEIFESPFHKYIFDTVNKIIKKREFNSFYTTFKSTGKIYYTDILEDLIHQIKKIDDLVEDAGFSYNESLGRIHTMKLLSEKYILNGFVGNSSPKLAYKDGILNIGIADEKNVIEDGFSIVGQISTEAWSYTIIDQSLVDDLNLDVSHCSSFDLPKGVYELNHTYGLSSMKKPFATLKRN